MQQINLEVGVRPKNRSLKKWDRGWRRISTRQGEWPGEKSSQVSRKQCEGTKVWKRVSTKQGMVSPSLTPLLYLTWCSQPFFGGFFFKIKSLLFAKRLSLPVCITQKQSSVPEALQLSTPISRHPPPLVCVNSGMIEKTSILWCYLSNISARISFLPPVYFLWLL